MFNWISTRLPGKEKLPRAPDGEPSRETGMNENEPALWTLVKASDGSGYKFEIYISVTLKMASGGLVALWSSWGKAKDRRGRSVMCNWIEIKLLERAVARTKRTSFGQILQHRGKLAPGSAQATFRIGKDLICLQADITSVEELDLAVSA